MSERALGFYLLQMQEGGTYKPLRDAAEWALVHLDYRRADKLILVARRLEELLEIDKALSDGEVPWTKVREIARVATPATEGKWLDRRDKELDASARSGYLLARQQILDLLDAWILIDEQLAIGKSQQRRQRNAEHGHEAACHCQTRHRFHETAAPQVRRAAKHECTP